MQLQQVAASLHPLDVFVGPVVERNESMGLRRSARRRNEQQKNRSGPPDGFPPISHDGLGMVWIARAGKGSCFGWHKCIC